MNARPLAALLALCLAGCSTAALRRSCAGAGAADAGTTAYGISNGASEVNPLMRPAPAALSLGLTVVAIAAADALIRSGHETAARSLLWGCLFLHGGAAVSNTVQLSKPAPPAPVAGGLREGVRR